ncbi:MAG: amidohydrolase family protein [Gemmatimonadaceae bacterium]|nr:amidohydrolase family protein [Gemmatimonadaceae bacterium]
MNGIIDVHTYIGGFPFRHIPHPEPEVLVRVLEREGIAGAWVGHLPSAYYRDPYAGNDALFAALEPHRAVLHPVPAIRPGWPKWEEALDQVAARGAVAVRAYPPQWGMGPHDPALAELAEACGARGLPLVLTTRFEDARQRHWLDTAGDLPGATIRAIVRASPRVRVLVTAAGRALVEEVHWGLTPEERSRVWWDISWIWGPPDDDLAHLFRTVGPHRFVYGSGWPLRLTQTPRANLELLPDELRDAQLAGAEVVQSG